MHAHIKVVVVVDVVGAVVVADAVAAVAVAVAVVVAAVVVVVIVLRFCHGSVPRRAATMIFGGSGPLGCQDRFEPSGVSKSLPTRPQVWT